MSRAEHGVGGDRGQGHGSRRDLRVVVAAQAWDAALGSQVGPLLSIDILEYQPSPLGAISIQGLIPWDSIKQMPTEAKVCSLVPSIVTITCAWLPPLRPLNFTT